MRRYAFLGLAMFMLVACSQTSDQSAAEHSTAHAVASATQPAFNQAFPASLEPPFAYKIRSRKTEETPNGTVHKLVIEFKQGDVATVDKQLEKILIDKGYHRYKRFSQGNGIVGDYGKDGQRVTITTSPVNGNSKLAPDSQGTVYFVWQKA